MPGQQEEEVSSNNGADAAKLKDEIDKSVMMTPDELRGVMSATALHFVKMAEPVFEAYLSTVNVKLVAQSVSINNYTETESKILDQIAGAENEEQVQVCTAKIEALSQLLMLRNF